MLAAFTWNQFILTTGVVFSCYYLILLPLFYREEIRRLLAGWTRSADRVPGQKPSAQTTIMGPASAGAAPFLTDLSEIYVAPLIADSPESSPVASLPAGLAEELKPLLAMAVETQAGRAEFTALLRLFLARYAPVTQSQQEAANHYILEQCSNSGPFELTFPDLQQLWPAFQPQL